MMNQIERRRLEQIRTFLPELFAKRPFLYIGANEKRFHFYDYIGAFGWFDVLERDIERAKAVSRMDSIRYVFPKDVRDIDFTTGRYDVVFWSHGPSTLEAKDFAPTVERIESVADEVVVMLTPWGRYDHEPQNPLDRNRTALYPEDFLKLGYAVATLGKPDENGSNILAWKET